MRSAPVRVFAALFVLYAALWLSWPPDSPEPARGDGSYHVILARGDGHYMYLTTLSLVYDLDINLKNQFRLAGDPFHMDRPGPRHEAYPIGTAIVQIPFFLVAHGVVLVANVFGAGIPTHGYTLLDERLTLFGALLAGFASAVLAYRVARRHLSATAALYGAVLAALGTPVLFYATRSPSYGHAWTAAAVALLVDYWDRTRGRHDLRRWCALGLLVGLAALTRLQEVVFAVLPVAEGLAEAARRARRRDAAGLLRLLGCFAAATALALVVVSPQIAANIYFYGSPLAVYSGQGYLRAGAPFFWEALYASRNGLFVWTPLAYAGVLGLVLAPRGARALAAGAGVAFLLVTWVNGSAWAWWSDFSFSNRRFTDATVVFALGLAFAVERLRALHARVPRLAPHAALLLLVLPWVAMNLELSWAVARSVAPVGRATSSSQIYAASIARIVDGARRLLGNVASWPANLVWALRHRVSPDRYDLVVGAEKLFIPVTDAARPGFRAEDRVVPTDASLAAGPWGKAETAGGRTFVPADDGARLLVPLFLAERVSFVVSARPHAQATLVVNGHDFPLPAGDVPQLRIDFPPGILHPGTNDVEIRCPASPCLALESIRLVYEAPP